MIWELSEGLECCILFVHLHHAKVCALPDLHPILSSERGTTRKSMVPMMWEADAAGDSKSFLSNGTEGIK